MFALRFINPNYIIMNTLIQSLFSYALVVLLMGVPILSFGQINLDSGLVGFFKLDANYADSSISAGHGSGSTNNYLSGINALPNTSVDFNGTTNFINCGVSNRGVSHTISISLWVKTTRPAGDHDFLIDKYNWSLNKGYYIAIRDGYPYITVRNGVGAGMHTFDASSSNLVNDDQWHHLLGEISGNSVKFYIDGVLEGSQLNSAVNPDLTNTNPLVLGSYYVGSASGDHNYYDGRMDAVRLYNRLLSSSEISYLSNQMNNAVTLNETVCGNYVSPSGNNVWNVSGTYSDIKYGSSVADSIFTINLTVSTLDTTITQVGSDLHAVSNSNYSYQWLDCNNGNSLIAGAQDSIYTPTANGDYAVEITQGNCVETSSCINYTGVGVSEFRLMEIQVYPNPVHDYLQILNGNNYALEIQILDITGKVLLNQRSNNSFELNVSSFANGIYFIRIQSEDKLFFEKFVVE